jgi:hypothetical protein
VGTDLYDALTDGVIAVPTSRPHLRIRLGGDTTTTYRRLHDPTKRNLPHLRTLDERVHGDDAARC